MREEGYLSIPEYYAEVERPASVRARALEHKGKERQKAAKRAGDGSHVL